jgi:hypothetical protein
MRLLFNHNNDIARLRDDCEGRRGALQDQGPDLNWYLVVKVILRAHVLNFKLFVIAAPRVRGEFHMRTADP